MFFHTNPIQPYTNKSNQTGVEYFPHKYLSHMARKLQLLAES